MVERSVDSVHDLDRDDRIEKLVTEVFRARGLGSLERRRPARRFHCRGIDPDFTAGTLQRLDDRPEVGRDAGTIDEHGFRRATDAGPPHLGIEDDVARHVEIGRGMNIGVTDTFEVPHDRHAGILLHAGDQALAATRHDDIHEIGHLAEQDPDGGTILGRDDLNRGLGQACRYQAANQTGVDRATRSRALAPAAQDHRVAALQTERAGIRSDVGPALINDSDYAERHPDALNLQPVRALPFGNDLTHRVIEIGNGLDTRRHRLDPGFVEREPIEHRRRQTAFPGGGHVA